MTFKAFAALAALSTAIPALPALADVPGPAQTVRSEEAGNLEVSEVASGLTWPWGIEFLPDGRMLVTEKPGRLRIIDADGNLLPDPVGGTPEVWAQGQGGLLDVETDPRFDENRLVWLTYAEAGDDGTAGTALGRGRLVDGALEDWQVVWRQEPKVEGPNHFGSRIVFEDDDTIYLALGERFKFDPAQDLSSELGKVMRMNRAGEALPDNPFVDDPNASDVIFTYGHRNIQAAAINPATGNLWVAEMGPLGGDELNLIDKGSNYGWPLVSWGTDYTGEDIPDPSTRPDLHGSSHVWTPVIAPSGMVFYEGELFPDFQGDAFIGSLTQHGLVRLEIEDLRVADEELLPLAARIRDVAVADDGAIYVAIDREDGAIWKIKPLGGGGQAGAPGQ